MKAIKTISDPEAFKLMADQTRRKIIFLLRAKEMTVSQIAGELNITPQTVYHHIKKLVKGDMVEVTREERVDHLIESYYQATAEVFHFMCGKTSHSKALLKETTEITLKNLQKIGFKLKYTQEDVAKLVELKMAQQDCCGFMDFEEKVSKLQDLDPLTKQDIQDYAGMLSTSDKEFVNQDELRKKFRKLLKSLIEK
ncbi:MAG: helix-turn-helix domain-containing protein [Candidatus Bathyarchaeota archaeon]|nr:helix-turn-helix domain-containing protein [Candidatus Bathyarchaeota archaeon]